MDPVVNIYGNHDNWDKLSSGQQERIKAKTKAITLKPPVPGNNGTIDCFVRHTGLERYESLRARLIPRWKGAIT